MTQARHDLLLLSNSTAPGRAYLEHARDAILDALDGLRSIVFVPFALADHDGYTNTVRRAMEPLGISVRGAHEGTPRDLVAGAEAVFVGGGNTFRLVKAIHELDLISVVRARAAEGMPYIGSSAGTNVATPSLRTTNDMPIVQPPSFETFGLVPFQINPHYLDPDPASTHQGETREERLTQFLEENDVPVLGMREGTWLRVRDGAMRLDGVAAGGRIFRRGSAPVEVPSGADVTWLVERVGSFDTPR
ncbi:dipeptidase PepE [Micromonospora olivasterospora]|uniref:dipeptidase E n=1 Tax=Micromonospora olivasterospora TaxID=1880 RepID=A0A562IHQ1_MICOL|nr:dipeptidase PepE [Micromonospora olivasterospora]TWH70547.1 dipeptidase E [Micromonospora olivasterospora]